MMAVQENAVGGRDPCFGRVGSGGKREGMAGHRSGPTPPAGESPRTKCDNSNADCGQLPSVTEGGDSTPCMTGSTGVTSCGRRGNV